MNYLFHLTIYFCIYAIIALSLNLVVGYCGLLTIAHAGFFAIGSYTYALVTLKLGWGFIPAVLLGIFIGVIFSFAVSFPSWRFKGNFFVLISLAVQVFLFSIFHNWANTNADIGTWENLTNGPIGISGIPKPSILGIKFDSIGSITALAIIMAIGTALLIWLLVKSPWGRLLKSIRDDELAARGLGKNVRLVKIQVFAVSCGLVSVAGAIYASYINYIDPSSASIDESILMLCMVMVGGIGNFRGPILGALILLMIPEILRLLNIPDSIAANLRLLFYGFLLMLMMHFRPQGLFGEYRKE
jgi:branched-chain amino acid transport system permease protein